MLNLKIHSAESVVLSCQINKLKAYISILFSYYIEIAKSSS